MVRTLAIVGALISLTVATRGEDGASTPADVDAINKEFAAWVIPGAKLSSQSSSMTKNGKVSGIAPATGAYSITAPFDEVVRFYVDRSGFEPPNWSILGRKFPGDKINIPDFWTAQMGKGKTVTIQHHIRPDSAIMTLLVSDQEGDRTTVVTVSRGLQDEATHIQIARHLRN